MILYKIGFFVLINILNIIDSIQTYYALEYHHKHFIELNNIWVYLFDKIGILPSMIIKLSGIFILTLFIFNRNINYKSFNFLALCFMLFMFMFTVISNFMELIRYFIIAK